MNDVQNLSFGSLLVRVVDRDGDPWFVATDVCAAMEIQNPSSAIKILDEDERGKVDIGGNGPDANIISESGLYTLMIRSGKAIDPETTAYKFRKWVTGEVLPAIRRNGRYDMVEAAEGARPEADDEQALELKLALVREARQTFGRDVARQMWAEVGLPFVGRMTPAGWHMRPRDDEVWRWMRDRTQAADGHIVRSGDLYEDYVRYCHSHAVEPLGHVGFGKELGRSGLAPHKSNGSWWRGIELKNAPHTGGTLN